MQTVDLPGVRIMVRTEGDQSAPPVLLLHGLGRDGSDLSPVGSALAGDHWVISPDQRGHGASGRADEYGFEWMRDDAVRLLDALGIERADLVGHPMGANVAWLVAAHYPDRVRRLVALDAVPPRGRRAFEPPQEPDADEDLPFDWPLYPAVLRELAEPKPDWWARLRDVTAPALIVGGGRDSHVDQATLADAASLVADCRLVIVGGGHRLHVARTAELLSELTPFLCPTPRPADSST